MGGRIGRSSQANVAIECGSPPAVLSILAEGKTRPRFGGTTAKLVATFGGELDVGSVASGGTLGVSVAWIETHGSAEPSLLNADFIRSTLYSDSFVILRVALSIVGPIGRDGNLVARETEDTPT